MTLTIQGLKKDVPSSNLVPRHFQGKITSTLGFYSWESNYLLCWIHENQIILLSRLRWNFFASAAQLSDLIGNLKCRYTNNSWQLPQKKYESSARESPCINNDSSSEAPSPPLSTPKSILSLPTSWSKQDDPLAPHQRPYPASVTVKVLRSNGTGTDFPLPSPGTDSQQDPSLKVDAPSHFVQEIDNPEYSTNDSNDQNVYNGQLPELQFDAFKDRRHCSLSSDKSAASSFINESIRLLNSMDRGDSSETGSKDNQRELDEGSNFTLDGISQQSLQREAALMKFRMKRKVRCFEKKVTAPSILHLIH